MVESDVISEVMKSECAGAVKSRTGSAHSISLSRIDLQQLAFGIRSRAGASCTVYLHQISRTPASPQYCIGIVESTPAWTSRDPLEWYCEVSIKGYPLLAATELRSDVGKTLILRGDRVIATVKRFEVRHTPNSTNLKLSWIKRCTHKFDVTYGNTPFGSFDISFPIDRSTAAFELNRIGRPALPIVASSEVRFTEVADDMVLPASLERLTHDETEIWFMINVLCRVKYLQMDFDFS